MAYAVESKKRKFDRILESLTDSASRVSQPNNDRTSLNSRNNSILSKATSLDAIKRRRVTPISKKTPQNTSSLTHYLPASRTAFLERLETFRHVTKWHIPSTISVNAAEWAKRGWYCADVDTITCGVCAERVVVDLDITLRQRSRTHTDADADADAEGIEDVQADPDDNNDDDEDGMQAEVYQALIQRYETMFVTSHADDCPWRKRRCDSSIQRIEGLLNVTNTTSSAKAWSEVLSQSVSDIPPVVDLPAYQDILTPSNDDLSDLGNINVAKLAICGWQFREADVVECKNCFRSLGLWLYRGPAPTVEHLDPVESHLEYCPWRSAKAQDSEVVVSLAGPDRGSKKAYLPGWALVYQAIHKQRSKNKQSKNGTSVTTDMDDDVASREHLSPEQREKRMKDLMKRVKEIRKPFNIKGLLKKKDK